MTSQISHSIKHRDSPKDKFYTPASLVRIHLAKFKDIPTGSRILEPFYGKGAYYNEMKIMFPTCEVVYDEIDLGLDFFDRTDPVDYIISNPPYSIIDKVLKHSISLKPKIISYLIAFHNLTAKRIQEMNNSGYFVTDFHLTKVFKWYGMSLIITFSNQATKNIIDFDRIVHT
jgi:hypothetical protein